LCCLGFPCYFVTNKAELA